MADLTPLATEIAALTTVVDSAVALIDSLADQLEAAKTDPAAIQALADSLRAQKTELSDAVVANTPAV